MRKKDAVKKIGSGEMTCKPSTLTLKVGETKSFSFETFYNDITWSAMPYFNGSTGEVSISHPDDTNTIEVTGETVGRIQVVASYKVTEIQSQIIGGVDVIIEK